jgi:hypothetical protein
MVVKGPLSDAAGAASYGRQSSALRRPRERSSQDAEGLAIAHRIS